MTYRKDARTLGDGGRNTNVSIVFYVALSLGCIECQSNGRTVPVCAVEDCATHQIVDDGCARGWFGAQCLACLNMCQPLATPELSTRRIESPSPSGVVVGSGRVEAGARP